MHQSNIKKKKLLKEIKSTYTCVFAFKSKEERKKKEKEKEVESVLVWLLGFDQEEFLPMNQSQYFTTKNTF